MRQNKLWTWGKWPCVPGLPLVRAWGQRAKGSVYGSQVIQSYLSAHKGVWIQNLSVPIFLLSVFSGKSDTIVEVEWTLFRQKIHRCTVAVFPSNPGSSQTQRIAFLHPLRLGEVMWLNLKCESVLSEIIKARTLFAILYSPGTRLAFKKVATLSSQVPELLSIWSPACLK